MYIVGEWKRCDWAMVPQGGYDGDEILQGGGLHGGVLIPYLLLYPGPAVGL